MRRLFLAGACLIAVTGRAHAVIEVNDPAALIQWGTSIKNEVAAYARQGQQYLTQLSQYEVEAQQLYGFIHNPNLGAVAGALNMVGLGSAMPVSPYAVMGLVQGVQYGAGGLPQIAGILNAVGSLSSGAYNQNHVFSPTDGSWNSQQLINAGNSIAGTQGLSLAAYQDLQTHQQTLDGLRTTLKAATMPKDVQDAQAEIDLENLWTANQQASLTALQIVAQTQDQARVQRENEETSKSLQGQIDQARAAGVFQ